MKASEFMVGDWVLNDEGTPFRVAQVTDYCYDGNSSDLMLENGDTYTDIEPMPITEDILQKIGFIKNNVNNKYFISDDYFDIFIYEWSDSIWLFKYVSTEMNTPNEQRTFSYVHNLQHALKDCGIEKEIVL